MSWISERSSTSLMHERGWPLALASLCSEDGKIVARASEQLVSDARAWCESELSSPGFLAAVRSRHPMNTPLMRFVAAHLALNAWVVPAHVVELAKSIFAGLCQTRINEDCHQRMRDKESRSSPSRVQSLVSSYQVLLVH
eukprot:2013739-Amphidinium_carterae.1